MGLPLPPVSIITILVVIVLVVVRLIWSLVNKFWLRPRKLEMYLRQQGLQGNPYTIFAEMKESRKLLLKAQSMPIKLSDDIVTRLMPHLLQHIQKYGKNSFTWFGPVPRVTLMNPDQIKHVMNNMGDFPKPQRNFSKLLLSGIAVYEGEKWAKHRKIITPAFNLEKLKIMYLTFYSSTMDMIGKWEGMMSSDQRSMELDVWPSLQDLTCDVIARTAFGSSYEEGRRTFELLKEQVVLIMKVIPFLQIPGWRFLPTPTNRKIKESAREIRSSLFKIVSQREKAMKAGAPTNDDLLGILLQSNHNGVGMSVNEVIEECKLFYFAGQETTSILLVWTMVLLSRYPNWQARAREEVLQVFGTQKKPDFDGLSHLRIVTMILYEVLRLYTPATMLSRSTGKKETKLGKLTLPAGVQVTVPILMIHQDTELWGDDAKEFNPERFADGVLKATKGQVIFLPFGWGPRICLGQNFAMLEAKMALSLILQRFSFELSPSYTHAPGTLNLLRPQHGAHLLIHKL